MSKNKKATRAIVSAAILLGALGLLLFVTMSQDAQAYKHVDEVVANPMAWYGKSLQLHGFVVGEVMVRPKTLEYRFQIENKGHAIPASYTGVVPDTFKTGAEVVLSGRLEPHGFVADGVTAKCPSKYTAAGPTGPTTGQ